MTDWPEVDMTRHPEDRPGGQIFGKPVFNIQVDEDMTRVCPVDLMATVREQLLDDVLRAKQAN